MNDHGIRTGKFTFKLYFPSLLMKVSLPDLILQEVFFSFLSTLSTLVLSLPPTMADNTRLEEAITIFTQTQSSLHSKLNDVISRFTILESRSPDRPLSLPPPRRKLDVPWFDGANAMSWIFKISQLFDYHGTPIVSASRLLPSTSMALP